MERCTHFLSAVVVGCFFLIGSGEASEAPQKSEAPLPGSSAESQGNNNAGANKYPTENAPLSVRVIQSPDDSARNAAREAEASEHERKDLDAQIAQAQAAKEQVITSWCVVALTLLGSGFLFFTLYETRRTAKAAIESAKAAMDQVAFTKRQEDRQEIADKLNYEAMNISLSAAKQSADAATRAAAAAEKSVNSVEDTAKRQLRAYVGIASVEVKNAHIQVRFVNHGHTPAHEVSSWGGHSFDEQVPKSTIEKLEQANPASSTIAWQGISNYISPFTGNLDTNIKSKIFIYGLIRYKDVFGEIRRTYFQFCSVWKSNGWEFHGCSDGNDAN